MFNKLAVITATWAVVAIAAPSNPLRDIMKRQSGEVVTGDAATSAVNDQDGTVAPVDQYVYYTGDGSDAAGWPDRSKWSSYEDLWNANVPLMQQSCGSNSWGDNDSTAEIAAINTAIEQVAAATLVDHRFILAIIMQESKGCVRVPTTNNGVANPGLMQDHGGSGTCANTNPCPQQEITQMVTDGTAGTAGGPGLAGLINQAQTALKDSSARVFYAAARLYNSGSADYTNLDDGITSTACYASDVANRLTGWTVAATKCTA